MIFFLEIPETKKYMDWTELYWFTDGDETILFKQYFSAWPNSEN